MESKLIINNQEFIGRQHEHQILIGASDRGKATLVIVYGRRRVGKTEMIEQAYQSRNILKFEGIHNKTQQEQINNVLWQLSEYAGRPMIAKLNMTTWKEVFKLLYELTANERWTLYFEEVQWLANHEDEFVADLKYAWDNFFKNNKDLIIVLCGSSPSFIINRIIKSKALYNRSQIEIPLSEFTLFEAKMFLKNYCDREVMNAYLLVGGIPEYLDWLKQDTSIFTSLCRHAFLPGGNLIIEHEKIFISSFSEKAHYKDIIKYLAKNKFATRQEILKHLKLQSSGTISEILEDLEICGFIEKYAPYNLNSDSRLSRYCIGDAYLQFYYKFIQPQQKSIQRGDYKDDPASAINQDTLNKWLGFSFERFCRKNHRLIARILGFHAVKYKSGAFYNKSTEKSDPGYQFDLIFDRNDHVLTLCEIKYLNKKVGTNVIAEMESKIERLNPSNKKTIHRVLICNEGAEEALIARHYFDKVITLEDLFSQP